MGPGWGDIGSRVGVCSGVMSWFGTRKLFASAGRQIKIHQVTHNITSNSSGHWEKKKPKESGFNTQFLLFTCSTSLS